MFPVVADPKIRTSTHHSHSRPFRPVEQRCARRNVFVRSWSGKRGQLSTFLQYAVYHISYHPPPPRYSEITTILSAYSKNHHKTGLLGGVQNKLCHVHALTTKHFVGRGHHGGSVRCEACSHACIFCWGLVIEGCSGSKRPQIWS